MKKFQYGLLVTLIHATLMLSPALADSFDLMAGRVTGANANVRSAPNTHGRARPQGVYSADQITDFIIFHFQGDILTTYKMGFPTGRVRVRIEGNRFIMSNPDDSSKSITFADFRNEGRVFHMRGTNGQMETYYKRPPGTVRVIQGYLY